MLCTAGTVVNLQGYTILTSCVVVGIEAEDIGHFLIRCEVFASERQRLLDKIGQVERTEERMHELYRAEGEGKTALLLGRRVEGMADQVAVRVGDWIMEGAGKTERFDSWGGLK